MRVVLVWEGVIATPPPERGLDLKERYRRLREKDTNWLRVVRSWEIHEKPLQRIYSLAIRGVPTDIVTYLGDEYADALRDHLDRMLIDVGRVEYFESAEHLARSLRISPDIQYVVDSDPARLAAYGRKALGVEMGDDWGRFI